MHGVYAPAVFFNEYLYVITRKSVGEAFQHLELPHPNAWACLALQPTREAQRGEQGSFQTESYNGNGPFHICCMDLCERGKGIGGRKFGGRKCEAACRFSPRFGRGQHATPCAIIEPFEHGNSRLYHRRLAGPLLRAWRPREKLPAFRSLKSSFGWQCQPLSRAVYLLTDDANISVHQRTGGQIPF